MEDDDAAPLVPLDGMDGEEVPAVDDDGADEARDAEDESMTLDEANEVAALVLCGNDDDGLPEDTTTAELERPMFEDPVRLADVPLPWLLEPELCGLAMEVAWPPEDDVDEGWLLQRPLASQMLPGGQSVSVLHTMPWVHPTVRPNTATKTTRASGLWFMAAPSQTRRRPARPT